MRKIFLIVGILVSVSATSLAQEIFPRTEIFGGFSYMNAAINKTNFIDKRANLHGWGANLAVNINRNTGFVMDFSGTYGHSTLAGKNAINASVKQYLFLFGPRFSSRQKNISIFGQFLAGETFTSATGISRDDALALDIGGGLDVNLNKRVSIRIFQVDYQPGRIRGAWFHDVRAQAGIVLKFGGK